MPTELLDRLGPQARLGLIVLMAAMLVAALLEGCVLSACRRGYDWRAAGASLVDALARRGVDALGLSLAAPLLTWVQAHRIADIPLQSPAAWAALLLGQEFCYYWMHRAGHRVGWFWATHCVHHSPRELTLAAAFRLGWTGRLSGSGLFFAPLLWLGFSPLAVLSAVAVNLLYQFWLHARWIPRLGALEWVFNTPAHHRVHHACNPACLDCNYGGILIVFDRLFGTCVAEPPAEPLRYGLSDAPDSHNPLRIAWQGWIRLGRALAGAPTLRGGWQVLAGPPAGWPGAGAGAAPPPSRGVCAEQRRSVQNDTS